ncbi:MULTISPECIES: AI-2E family transporter [unclassified Bosea (in: a-proteobacteria)]|uniref:AI-2E family transporter n=1 Tax=unclassified Bosea (in: a-proteobacteria) TaxID=2653178 RepID=UPI000F7518A2|nr:MULTISPECIES: AI-2E family transporter [unclassified Bosea (in: a-proteobacteria)]AZO81987.1 transporter [Bosea sp. Tri-49]RXT16694.1 transporter [Bosea sp. Tri-39]RXT42385.1 transporter [Bosea sp. Tri-54]
MPAIETSSAMQNPATKSPINSVANVATGAFIIAALYFGREVFVPVALAILFSFVLAPLVKGLQKLRVPRALAVFTVVLIAFATLAILTMAMVSQATQLAGQLPTYQSTMRAKISALKGSEAGSGVLSRAADILQDLSKELDRPKAEFPPSTEIAGRSREGRPIPVEVHQPEPGAIETLQAFLSPLIHPLTTTGIVLIFVIFILLKREDLRNRFIRLTGTHDLQKTTAAFDDAARRLSRLFLTQLIVNAGFGVVIGCGLWAIGVPSSLLWGILAAILRFIPYLGAVLSAVFPMVIAASVDPGWMMLALTAGLFVIAEPLVGHVIEPLAYGRSTGLSPVAIVVAATFWTWLWGPIGLVLATPLTVCLVVLGRHVERLEFLDVMLGDRPPLSAPEIFYQRILAGDPAEAADKAEEVLKERSLSAYYDEVALEGLRLAAADEARGVLDAARRNQILATVREVVEDLADHDDSRPVLDAAAADPETEAAVEQTDESEGTSDLPILAAAELGETFAGRDRVVCIGARSQLDEAAALMLSQILEKHGLAAEALPPNTLLTSGMVQLAERDPALICLCYIGPQSAVHMKYALRRLRRHMPLAILVLGQLSQVSDPKADDKGPLLADAVETSLRGICRVCLKFAAKGAPA